MKNTNPLKEYIKEQNITTYALAQKFDRNLRSSIYRFTKTENPKDLKKKTLHIVAIIKKTVGVDMFEWLVENIEIKNK